MKKKGKQKDKEMKKHSLALFLSLVGKAFLPSQGSIESRDARAQGGRKETRRDRRE
jgi:hypothetical protein